MIRNLLEDFVVVVELLGDERCYDLHEMNNFDDISLTIKIL